LSVLAEEIVDRTFSRPARIYVGPPEESGSENDGLHGGLARNEMYVPLVIPE